MASLNERKTEFGGERGEIVQTQNTKIFDARQNVINGVHKAYCPLLVSRPSRQQARQQCWDFAYTDNLIRSTSRTFNIASTQEI